MTNPADIARALSEAQKTAMTRWLERDNGHVWAYLPTLTVLKRKGLVHEQVGGSGWALFTPLGLAVRDYLLHRPTIDASTDRNQAKVVRCGKGIE